MRLWQSGLMDRVTYIASIVGLMVVGAMTASMIDITTPLSFTAGQTTMKVQDFIDKILPSCCRCSSRSACTNLSVRA